MYINPYENLTGGRWMKMNLHTHAGTGPGTCGRNDIDSVVALYKQFGVNILCISNHNLFTDTSAYTDDEILLLPGVEYTVGYEHMLTIGAKDSYHECGHQEAIDRTARDGGFTVINHPNWQFKQSWPLEKMLTLHGYTGLEVLNGVIFRLKGTGLAADVWDALLSQGKLVYGFSNDDFHLYGDVGRSNTWIYVRGTPSYDTVLASVQQGCFCASSGIMPAEFDLADDTIHVRAQFEKESYIDAFTYTFTGENGQVLQTTKGKDACFRLQGERYVRVTAQAEHGALLFFQPVYREGALLLP